jgi:hypothetical protein
MLLLRASFAIALAATCAGCGGGTGNPGTGGTGGTTTTSSSSTSGSSTSTSSSTTTDPTVAQCKSCVEAACSAEKTACNSDCYAIQACLDTVCENLSATNAPSEGACQAYCENQHPNGKSALVAYAGCIQGTMCNGCAGPPYDYEQCAQAQIGGPCQSAAAACAGSADCMAYQSCVSGCATDTACEACSSGTSGTAGEMLYYALQSCIDQTCLSLYWLPSGP